MSTLDDPSSEIDNFTDFFVLVRGISTVLHSAFDLLVQGRMKYLTEHDYDPPSQSLSDDTNTVFQELYRLANLHTHTDTDQETYHPPIRELRRSYETFYNIRAEPTLVTIWAVRVSDQFVGALKRNDPLALVIVAHYAVLLYGIRDQWWAKGRGKAFVEAIAHMLPSQWWPAVCWPLKVVHGVKVLDLKSSKVA